MEPPDGPGAPGNPRAYLISRCRRFKKSLGLSPPLPSNTPLVHSALTHFPTCAFVFFSFFLFFIPFQRIRYSPYPTRILFLHGMQRL
jgi:hypothetical protein